MTRDEDQGVASTRPYLIRALHEWCTDNGLTPHLAVRVDGSVRVPVEYVRNNEIVLNVGYEATNALKLGNEFIEFKARFGGVPREIVVPVGHVLAIYARENGQGMAFPPPDAVEHESNQAAVGADAAATPDVAVEPGSLRSVTGVLKEGESQEDPPPPGPAGPVTRGGGRPQLKRVK